MFYKIISTLHKVVGCILCILFFMWFASGIVMIYHSFPRASQEKYMENQLILSADLPAVDSLRASFPDTVAISGLQVEMYLDKPVFVMDGMEGKERYDASDCKLITETIDMTVRSWCSAPVESIDTLTDIDQWIPFGRNRDDLPVYRYNFADSDKHQLYVSSQTGKVLQFTTSDERFWAWVGAIPHWVYFTMLRAEQDVWINFVKWAAGIGCIMCLLGFVLAIRIAIKGKGIKKKVLPYKKKWFNWHYVTGMVFGLCAITFAFSGMMSLMDIPDFLKKAPVEKTVDDHHSKEKGKDKDKGRGGRRGGPGRFGFGGGPVDFEAYALDYRKAVSAYPNAKTIAWCNRKGHPYYQLNVEGKIFNIDATDSLVAKPFTITQQMVEDEMAKTYGDSLKYTIARIDEFDDDYFSLKVEENSLPVYRVIVEDYMNTRHYINPVTLQERRVDDDSRTRHLLYRALHTLEFKFLTDRPWLWNIVMYTLLIGGTMFSITGVVLSFKWLWRIVSRPFRRRKNKK